MLSVTPPLSACNPFTPGTLPSFDNFAPGLGTTLQLNKSLACLAANACKNGFAIWFPVGFIIACVCIITNILALIFKVATCPGVNLITRTPLESKPIVYLPSLVPPDLATALLTPSARVLTSLVKPSESAVALCPYFPSAASDKSTFVVASF